MPDRDDGAAAELDGPTPAYSWYVLIVLTAIFGLATIDRAVVPLVLEPIAAKHHPSTPYDAKFSAPWAIAHHLVHGELTLTSFSAERIADPRLLELAGRVDGGAWTDGEPPSRFCGAVTVTAGGSELREVVPFTPGSPGNPRCGRPRCWPDAP